MDQQSSHYKETLTQTLLKSLWFTVPFWLLMISSSVIFMGIEGNHYKLSQWRNLAKQAQFNKTLYKWITKSKSAKATSLRAEIGLNDSLEEAEYVRIAQKQMNKNYTKLFKTMKSRCKLAKLDLNSWHNMTRSRGDVYMYVASILSTVGWGVHSPQSRDLRAITMVYALFGIPLFTAFVGFLKGFVEYVETRMKGNKNVEKYLGGGTTINIVMCVVMLAVFVSYSWLSLIMVDQEKKHKRIKEDLEVLGTLDHWDYLTAIYFTFQTVSTIGFGDEYIYSAGAGCLTLYLKPIILISFIAILIALFTHVFGKIQRHYDKNAAKRSEQSHEALSIMKEVVKMASKAASNSRKSIFTSNSTDDIQNILLSIRDDDSYRAMVVRKLSKRLKNNDGPIVEMNGSFGSQQIVPEIVK